MPWAKLFYKIIKPISIRPGLQIWNHQVTVCGGMSIYGTSQSFLKTLISY
jgi:hypothetical protein